MAAAVTTTRLVNHWLASTHSARLLHLFQNTCNLANEMDEIISLVLPGVGAGPFALVIDETRPYPEYISPDSPISIGSTELRIGQLVIDLETVTLWNPVVAWDRLQSQKAIWQQRLPELERMVANYRRQLIEATAVTQQRLQEGVILLLKQLQARNQPGIQAGVRQLAGLGRGLTPAGDDILLGMIYGLRAVQPEAQCQPLIEWMVATALPLTTTLSGAWFKAAGRGEAVEAWHQLCQWLLVEGHRWRAAAGRILETGYSSGADALWGFTAVISQMLKEGNI